MLQAFEEHIENDLDAPPEARETLQKLLAILDLAVLTDESDRIEAAQMVVRQYLLPALSAIQVLPRCSDCKSSKVGLLME